MGREREGECGVEVVASSMPPTTPSLPLHFDLRAGQQGEVGDGEEGDVLDGLAEAGCTGHGICMLLLLGGCVAWAETEMNRGWEVARLVLSV